VNHRLWIGASEKQLAYLSICQFVNVQCGHWYIGHLRQ
jgi:hypothetical protein